MATISLVMIVKNEEKILRKSLDSVKDIIDEFIIVDTGSTDNTRDIIKEYGKLYEIPFKNFVETKNEALKLATSDYILFMDADETVVNGLELIKSYAENGVDCLHAQIVEGSLENPYNLYLRARLWKNNGSYKFEGPNVHEVITGEGIPVIDTNIKVLHSHEHKTQEDYITRFTKYIELLSDYSKKHLDDTRSVYYLGRTHQDLGNFQEAIHFYKKYLKMNSKFRDEMWDAAYNIGKCWKAQGEYEKAIVALEAARKYDPRRAEVDFLLGQIHYDLQNIELSISYFKKSFDSSIPEDVVLFLNPKLYNELPAEYLVLLYNKLHNYEGAIKYTNYLITLQPSTNERLINNLTVLNKSKIKTFYFCLGNTPEEVYGGMIKDKGVGGVETTYLELPASLAKNGHNVIVFCKCKTAHKYDNVYYIPYSEISDYTDIKPDVVITSRWFEPFYIFPEAKKIIWAQDAHFKDPEYPDAYDIADAVVCSSLWHRQYIAERFGDKIPKEKLHIIPLSIRKELFENKNVKRKPYKVIYSSNPDRGLYILRNMWKELTDKLPEIELTITYGWEGLETWSNSPEWLEKIARDKREITEWAKDAGNITLTGRLTKAELAKEMMSSSLCLYPNNFWESFCLTALETQAAGTPMITTNLGALSTTLNNKNNILLDEYQYSEEYAKEFVKNTVDLLRNQKKLKDYSKKCKEYMSDYPTWEEISKIWERLVYDLS